MTPMKKLLLTLLAACLLTCPVFAQEGFPLKVDQGIHVIDVPELTSRGPKVRDRSILSCAASLLEFVPRRLFDE